MVGVSRSSSYSSIVLVLLVLKLLMLPPAPIVRASTGGNGYINDYPTGRLLRDAKLYEIGAGTSEIRRMLIGRELFQQTRDL